MKVKVDKELCTGCELCCNTCPDIFEMEGDTATVKTEIVPEAAEDCVRQAAEDCPVSAIIIEEE
ncbi:MAG: ferredoxin [candidate division WOR-3 bacterium]|nr:ferredoxin [candidate division WOR-3 bacterium]